MIKRFSVIFLSLFLLACDRTERRPDTTEPNKIGLAAGYGTCVIYEGGDVNCQAQNIGHKVITGLNAKAASVGTYNICIIKGDDEVKCFTHNYADAKVPENLGKVKSIAVGHYDVCVLKIDDTLQCWRNNIDHVSGLPVLDPLTVPFDEKVKKIAAGMDYMCAITTDDDLKCWNVNQAYQTDGAKVPVNIGKVKSVAGGESHACAIKADDTVQCWGSNTDGKTTVPDDIAKVKDLSIGLGSFSCVVKEDNTVRCWGRNMHGETAVPNDLTNVNTLAVGVMHGCVLRDSDNKLQCWGDNGDYRLLLKK